MITLTAKDWEEIWYALQYKRDSESCAGEGQEAVEWRAHLNAILDKIGSDGATAAVEGVEPEGGLVVTGELYDGQIEFSKVPKGAKVVVTDYDGERENLHKPVERIWKYEL